jgi:hypothetical protein
VLPTTTKKISKDINYHTHTHTSERVRCEKNIRCDNFNKELNYQVVENEETKN